MAVAERWRGTRAIRLSTNECERHATRMVGPDVRIRALYLFGSRGRGARDVQADVDLAIWTSEEFTWTDLYELRGRITSALRSERVDLVWLNKAEPVMAFQVLKTGRALMFRDVDELNALELRMKQRFWDHAVYLRGRRRRRRGVET